VFRQADARDVSLLVRHGRRLRSDRPSAPPWIDTVCDRAGAARFIADFHDRSAAATGAVWFMVPEGEIRAGVIYTLMPGRARTFELGVWCEEEFRGRGLVSAGLEPLLPRAARQLCGDAIIARTAISNRAARGLFERLGFALAAAGGGPDEASYRWHPARHGLSIDRGEACGGIPIG
jgi:RimJ/RimL family protein N-acetyltransferase